MHILSLDCTAITTLVSKSFTTLNYRLLPSRNTNPSPLSNHESHAKNGGEVEITHHHHRNANLVLFLLIELHPWYSTLYRLRASRDKVQEREREWILFLFFYSNQNEVKTKEMRINKQNKREKRFTKYYNSQHS